MSRIRRHYRVHPLLVAIIFLATMLARVVVPGGFMPMATADGRVVLAPCSGHVAATPTAAHHGHHKADQPASTADGRCAFADLSVPLADDDASPVALFTPAVAAAPFSVPSLGANPHAAAHQRPPPRGPPPAA